MRLLLGSPIVTRTLRSRLRGARVLLWPGLYLLGLIAILVLILILLREDLLEDAPGAFRAYFGAVVAIDLVAMVLVATINTATHLARERELRTLEFIRISRLSPIAITLGHLFGGLSIPLILAGVSAPLAVLASTIAGIHAADLLYMVGLLAAYSLFASSFALAVGMLAKKSATAGGLAISPLLLFGIFGVGFGVQKAWVYQSMTFLSPLNFLMPLVWKDRFLHPLDVQIPIYEFPVNSFLFNMAVLVFASVVLILGVSRKMERPSRSFLSAGQAFVVLSIVGAVMAGLFYSGVGEAASFSADFRRFGMGPDPIPPIVVLFLSLLVTMLVGFFIVTSPTRDRLLRAARRMRFTKGDRSLHHARRRALLYKASILGVFMILIMGVLSREKGSFQAEIILVGGIVALMLIFYSVAIEEMKLCFGETYKGWLTGCLVVLWVVLPGLGMRMAEFEVLEKFAWSLCLMSPTLIFTAAMDAFPELSVFGKVPPNLFLGISMGMHLFLAAALALHLSRYRRVVIEETMICAEPLAGGDPP